MKSFLSTKSTIFSQISLKNSKFISDHFNLSKQFNTLFEDVGRSLNINKDNSDLSDFEKMNVTQKKWLRIILLDVEHLDAFQTFQYQSLWDIAIAIEMFEKYPSVQHQAR